MKSNLHEGNILLSINVTILDQITSLNLFYKSMITFLGNLGIPLYILCMHIIWRDVGNSGVEGVDRPSPHFSMTLEVEFAGQELTGTIFLLKDK